MKKRKANFTKHVGFLPGILFLSLVLLVGCNQNSDSTELILVDNGKSNSCIVLPSEPSELQKIAVTDFVKTVQIATGVEIPEISEEEIAGLSKDVVQILIGPSRITESLGFDGTDLKPEEFQIKTKGNNVIILARDIEHEIPPPNIWNQKDSENSRVTQWALGYLLDRFLGVLWIWPGDMGTHIPKVSTFSVPRLDVQFQQPLVRRTFNPIDESDANLHWLHYHQFAGSRENYHFQHSFREKTDNGDWWGNYLDEHPDWFAKNPEGKPELEFGRETFFKLCISNPEVKNKIITLWEEAGMPDYWDVTPNDGHVFCTCDDCRALDEKYGGTRYTKEEVWNPPPNVSMTDRYAWFWNELLDGMRMKNPNVKIGIFLYGAFKEVPKKLELNDGIIGLMVHGFDFAKWEAWENAGVTEIGLRPNWLYMGASGPHIPLAEFGSYMEKAREHHMGLIELDCFHEFWATQGINYYLFARLTARPDLNAADVIEEYISVFGNAAPEIREYLDYWETYHKKVSYNIPAGGSIWRDSTALYATASRKVSGRLMLPLRGHWETLPYIYNEDVLQAANQILDKASEKVTESILKERIDFLRDGLVGITKDSDYILGKGTDAGKEEFMDKIISFNKEMKEKHGYWNPKDEFFIKYWGLYGKARVLENM